MIFDRESLAQGNKETRFKRGFVTIATGNQKYYQLALNLLGSYRAHGNSSVPFALICDRDCPIARKFDDMVLVSEPHYSYLDKLYLYQYTPYEETIFIDADSFILGDVSVLWSDFEQMGDFSCYGQLLPLESHSGWFYYKDMGALQSQLKFGISMHGGLYYLRKTERCCQVFTKAIELSEHYNEFKFANFQKPADEPVLALSMALADCRPCPQKERIIFLPSHDGQLYSTATGTLMLKDRPCKEVILHFGSVNVTRFLYQYLYANIECINQGNAGLIPKRARNMLRVRCLPIEIKAFVRRKVKKIIPRKIINWLRR